MVEIMVSDEAGQIAFSLIWRKGSKEVCYRFPTARIAKASFKALARLTGVEEDTWRRLGI